MRLQGLHAAPQLPQLPRRHQHHGPLLLLLLPPLGVPRHVPTHPRRPRRPHITPALPHRPPHLLPHAPLDAAPHRPHRPLLRRRVPLPTHSCRLLPLWPAPTRFHLTATRLQPPGLTSSTPSATLIVTLHAAPSRRRLARAAKQQLRRRQRLRPPRRRRAAATAAHILAKGHGHVAAGVVQRAAAPHVGGARRARGHGHVGPRALVRRLLRTLLRVGRRRGRGRPWRRRHGGPCGEVRARQGIARARRGVAWGTARGECLPGGAMRAGQLDGKGAQHTHTCSLQLHVVVRGTAARRRPHRFTALLHLAALPALRPAVRRALGLHQQSACPADRRRAAARRQPQRRRRARLGAPRGARRARRRRRWRVRLCAVLQHQARRGHLSRRAAAVAAVAVTTVAHSQVQLRGAGAVARRPRRAIGAAAAAAGVSGGWGGAGGASGGRAGAPALGRGRQGGRVTACLLVPAAACHTLRLCGAGGGWGRQRRRRVLLLLVLRRSAVAAAAVVTASARGRRDERGGVGVGGVGLGGRDGGEQRHGEGEGAGAPHQRKVQAVRRRGAGGRCGGRRRRGGGGRRRPQALVHVPGQGGGEREGELGRRRRAGGWASASVGGRVVLLACSPVELHVGAQV